MPQVRGVKCLLAVLKAATAFYAALRACDSDFLEDWGLEGWESDLEDLLPELRAFVGQEDELEED